MNDKIVEMKNISLTLDTNNVLSNADFYLKKGEVCSILGENGAGKSTLMKVLTGSYPRYTGDIRLDGQEEAVDSVVKAQKNGIRMIHQESQLINEFNVEQNIFSGNEICYPGLPFINKKLQRQKAREILDFLQTDIDINAPVQSLNIAQKKMVEIARSLVYSVKVLVLDEVTASFTSYDRQTLFEIIRKLKEEGIAVVFISHKIEEVLEIADRIVIMRDGKTVEDKPIENNSVYIDVDHILLEMAGDDYINRYPKTKAKIGNVVMKMHKVSNAQKTVMDASLYIREGEIVGIAGLVGAGKSSLAKLIAGVEPIEKGECYYKGKPMQTSKLDQFVKDGIIYLAEDCASNLILKQDVQYNMSLSSLDQFIHTALISHNKVQKNAKYYIDKLDLRKVSPHTTVQWLSRGTQQKVALSKWLKAQAQVMVLDEPSISLDIASKVELYNILNKISHTGKSIFMVSSDLTELIGMCDRIYVMFSGKIAAELDSKEANSVRILQYASGKM
ncbi:sugar ABC transporter ATP-binding protein [Christensenella timonensis]|uniref:sugar ABC transporter ATP-binding protein n=1 Tax=Christensenella timonensis TaxID=1816678 RepID=UPI000A78E0D7|nr:sugar ABC transporter ATP-binding protein [Christensenella timonensis]